MDPSGKNPRRVSASDFRPPAEAEPHLLLAADKSATAEPSGTSVSPGSGNEDGSACGRHTAMRQPGEPEALLGLYLQRQDGAENHWPERIEEHLYEPVVSIHSRQAKQEHKTIAN